MAIFDEYACVPAREIRKQRYKVDRAKISSGEELLDNYNVDELDMKIGLWASAGEDTFFISVGIRGLFLEPANKRPHFKNDADAIKEYERMTMLVGTGRYQLQLLPERKLNIILADTDNSNSRVFGARTIVSESLNVNSVRILGAEREFRTGELTLELSREKKGITLYVNAAGTDVFEEGPFPDEPEGLKAYTEFKKNARKGNCRLEISDGRLNIISTDANKNEGEKL